MNRTEVLLTERLIRTGRLSASAMERCLQNKRPGEGLIDTLIQQKAVTTHDLELILGEMPKVAPEPDTQPPPPKLDRYLVLSPLGRGGMGRVYLAYDTKLKRSVALKVMRVAAAEDLARYRREVEIASSLRHPNIAAVYDTETAGDDFVIAMQYVDGESLERVKLSIREALEIAAAAATALQAAHDRGIIHRDLKPENLMRAADGHLYLLDFGIARRIEATRLLTQSGTILGTPAYMSPEQARGGAVDARSDVYSLGATLYALVTHQPPFRGDSLLQLLRRVEDEEPVRPRALNPQLHRDIETIVLKAMNKNPRRRYATARDLAADLGRFLAGEPIQARPQPLASRVWTSLRKRPWAMVLVVSVAVAAIAGTTVGMIQWRRQAADDRTGSLAKEAGELVDRWELNLYLPPQDLTPHRALLEDALRRCDEADRIGGGSVGPVHRQRARALARLDDPRGALRAIDRAVELDPDVTNLLLRIQLRLRLIEIDLTSLDYYLDAGWGRTLPGLPGTFDPEQMKLLQEDCRRAVKLLGPGLGETAMVDALDLCLKGRIEEAERVARAALPGAQPAQRVQLCKLLAMCGYQRVRSRAVESPDLLNAPISDVTAALDFHRSDHELYLWRAALQFGRGSTAIQFIMQLLPPAGSELDAATLKEHWKKALATIRPGLAGHEARIKEARESALGDIRNSLKIRPGNPRPHLLEACVALLDAPVRDILDNGEGWATARNPQEAMAAGLRMVELTRGIFEGCVERAKQSCRKAEAMDPRLAAAWMLHSNLNHFHLTYPTLLDEEGRSALIRETLEASARAIELVRAESSLVELHSLRFRAYVLQGDERGAREELERVAALNPRRAEGLKKDLPQ